MLMPMSKLKSVTPVMSGLTCRVRSTFMASIMEIVWLV